MTKDYENEIFTAVATALRAAYDGIFVTGEYTPTPARFPAVSLVEMDNSTYERTLDSSDAEHHASLMYQVDCYSNLSSGKKSQCKSIMATIDALMLSMGFVRTSRTPMDMPNAETSIYRMTSRYKAVIDNNNKTYRR